MFAVREPGQRLGLAPEHPEVLVVDEVPAAHDLEGDSPVRVLLLGLEDDPHPALAELAEDAEAEVYESRPLTRELEAPAVVGNQPDGRGRKETAELDGDALKLTILEPRAWIRHGENRIARPGLKLLGWGCRCCCVDNAERSCDRVAGRLGQEDLPGCEDEVSDRAAVSIETEPRNHQENAFLAHRPLWIAKIAAGGERRNRTSLNEAVAMASDVDRKLSDRRRSVVPVTEKRAARSRTEADDIAESSGWRRGCVRLRAASTGDEAYRGGLARSPHPSRAARPACD